MKKFSAHFGVTFWSIFFDPDLGSENFCYHRVELDELVNISLSCKKRQKFTFSDPLSFTFLVTRHFSLGVYMEVIYGGKKISEKIEVKVANDRELNGEQFSPQSTYMKCDYLYPKIAFFQKVGAFSGFSVLTDLTMCYSV